MERWLAQFIRSAQNQDTVYIASFTYGTGINEPINGSSWGINKLYSDRTSITGAAPVRVIADGDDVAAINATLNPLSILKASPSNPSNTHNKVITLGARAVMTGSMNFTAGGNSEQPNNMVIIRVPSVAQAFLRELDDQYLNNNFVENTPSSQNLFTAPNGDRIEVFFAPDENGNINLSPYGNGKSIKDVLLYHIGNANESVFYMINIFGMSTELANALTAATPAKLVEGWFDNDPFSNKSALQADHTARDWNNFSASTEGHHKVMIFDMDIVATGSANQTYASMRDVNNVENEVVIYDFRLARKFMQEYRRSMALVPPENIGQADGFEQNVPGAVTNLAVADVAGASNQLQVTWTAPSNNDLSRHYVFVSPTPISTKRDIGDGIDNDGDGHIDEDPVGDADGFQSGSSSLLSNDDDADGLTDEDQWMYPEVQVKSQTAGASLSAVVSTVNVGDTLLDNTNYWIAVIAVDKHGNEGPISVFGPVQSLPPGPGAQPSASVAFTPGSSEVILDTGSLSVVVSNSSQAQSAIHSVQIDFGVKINSFTVASLQSPPLGWSVKAKSSASITITADSPQYDIAAGSSKSFPILVLNPSVSGTSDNVNVTVTAANSLITGPVAAGVLTIQSAQSATVTGAADGTNTITNFSGSASLQAKPITVSFKFASSPTSASSVELWWDAEAAPDGPAGSSSDTLASLNNAGDTDSKTFQAVIPSNVPEIVNGANVRFIIRADGVTYKLSGSPWAFLIDSFAETVSGLSVSAFGSNNVTLTWTPLVGVSDFGSYRIYYSTVSPVTNSSSAWTIANDPNLQAMSNSQTTVTGLSPLTTYYFSIVHRDVLANESALSAQASQATSKQITATVTAVTDGVNTLIVLDGTGKLLDQSATVRFNLSSPPVNSSTVAVYYDVGADPDGPFTVNPQDRKATAVGSGSIYEAIIPGADDEIVPGALVRIGIFVDGSFLLNGSVTWQYQIGPSSSEVLRNLRISDTAGGSVTLTWSPSLLTDFKEYRVYYTTADTVSTTNSTIWGVAQDFRLNSSANNQTTVSGLSPNTLYRFNVASVNSVGSSGGLDVTQQQAATTNNRKTVLISEISPVDSTDNFVELYTEVGPVRVVGWKLTDMDGNVKTLPDVTLTTVTYMVAHSTAGVDETDTSGPGANGIFDVYSLPAGILPAAGDQVALVDASGDTIDAVPYWDGVTPLSADDLADLGVLNTLGAWTGSDTSSVLRHIGQGDFTLARKEDLLTARKYNDVNVSGDFELTPSRTIGAHNAYLSANVTSIADVLRTITALDGNEILRADTATVTMSLSPAFTADTRVSVVYTTDGSVPTSASASRSASADSTKTIFTAKLPPAADGQSVSVKILVGGTVFDASGRSWRFKVDAGGPPAIGGFTATSRTSSAISLTWNPLTGISDFFEYRIYYDTASGITTSSRLFSSKTSASLANASTSNYILSGLAPGDTYYFRITAADQAGNTAPLTSEVSAATPNPLLPSVSKSVDATTNVVTDFAGSSSLRAETLVISFSFSTFPQNASTVEIWWDTVANSDGPGGSATDTRVAAVVFGSDTRNYTATINGIQLGAAAGSTLNWIIRADSVNLYLSGTTPWKVALDGVAGAAPGNISILPDPSIKNSTSLNIRWNPVSAADFAEYLVYYAAGANVTKSDTKWTKAKDPALKNISTNYTIVNGLAASVAYTFGVVFRDALGNESALSDTVRQTTNATSPAQDPAYDGINVAHLLDGTETLQDTDILIEMLMDYAPADPSSVKLWYDVGATPDGPEGLNTEDRWVPMWDNPDRDSTSFVARIRGDDKEMVDGALVKYVVELDGFVKNNGGRPYMYKLDGSAPGQVTGLSFGRDLGATAVLRWTPITAPADFAGYRIYMSLRHPARRGGYISKAQYLELGNASTGQLILTVPADTNVFFNVVAVDAVGHESQVGDDAVLLRVAAPAGSSMVEKVEAAVSAPAENLLLWHPTAGEAQVQMDAWGRKTAVFGPIPGPGRYYLVILSETKNEYILSREFNVTDGQYILWDLRNQDGFLVPPGEYIFELSSDVKVYTGQTYGYGGMFVIR